MKARTEEMCLKLLRFFLAVLKVATTIILRFVARLDRRLGGYQEVVMGGLCIIAPEQVAERIGRIWNGIAEQDAGMIAQVERIKPFYVWYQKERRIDLSVGRFFSVTDQMLALSDEYLEGYLVYFCYAILSVNRGLAATGNTPRQAREIIGERARRLTVRWLCRRGKDSRVIGMFRSDG